MSLPWLLLLVTLARSQTIDQGVLNDIFGPPPTTGDVNTTPRLEDLTVKPTEGISTFVDGSGAECQCVPYYLCDAALQGVQANNESVTGWGQLDIRLGDNHECQESVEQCCTAVLPAPRPAPTPAPAPRGCGVRNVGGIDFTVTGGSGLEAGFGEYPWVVALLDSADQYVGVGVLVDTEVVLTGAHVVAKYPPSSLKIRAGEWDTQTSKERLPHQERGVREMVIHEDFRPKSLWNDVALLRLSEPVVPDQHIDVICLPDPGESFEGRQDCVANGWGRQLFGQAGRYAVILKRVVVNMVPSARCQQQLQRTRLGPRFTLHRSFVCAGGEEGRDTCQGDGGAPLACPVGDRYRLAGLVAWGIGCGQKDVPAVYANVAMFRNWIDNKMAAWGRG
ncbi:phenoloxidase-activating factor 2 isoform X2 [Plutella xylostella]|uniref:phenoloxidase-activating factor 2 isoform X1 n=1 Tax=Plutella xylostella TaxID=51655 RepID=UPI0020327D0E|nr:phenoloxidase-activating factor 2 isoform X1 [Plutella xylostella]XP_048485904.1 phenoloxidase-activating factor 2 isoform X2 [Plutella xylostella]